MVVWLASYPRSGNTFFRVVLKQAFGVPSSDKYDPNASESLRDQEYFGDPGNPPHADFRVIKTHDLPSGHESAIYLVRDGRDAMVSFAQFVMNERKINGEKERRLLLRELIETAGSFGGWSQNVDAWTKRDAPTVVVRFENLIADPINEVRRALRAIGINTPELAAGTIPTFRELQSIEPLFFRKGRVGGWRDEMPEDLHLLFWRRHGHVMRSLGYSEGEPSLTALAGAPLEAGNSLRFASSSAGSIALGVGWGEPEDWGTWSIAQKASLYIAAASAPGSPIKLDLSYRSFVEGGRSLRIVCRAEGRQVSAWTCDPTAWRGVQRITVPSAIAIDGAVRLEFDITEPRSPAELNLGVDTRQLGIGVEELRHVPA